MKLKKKEKKQLLRKFRKDACENKIQVIKVRFYKFYN